MNRFYEPDLTVDGDSPFVRDAANKLVAGRARPRTTSSQPPSPDDGRGLILSTMANEYLHSHIVIYGG